MGGSKTISTSDTRIEALDLQSSSYGVTIPLLHGVNKVACNLIWYGGFQAIAHTTTQSGGGKGGGTSMQNTTYTYQTSLIMGLCEGTITAIPRAWVGQAQYVDGATSALAQLGFSMLNGDIGQAVWGPLPGIDSANAIGYSGLACVAAQNYQLGGSAQLQNHNFEVVGQRAYTVSGVPDADPSLVISDWITNQRYGVGIDSSMLGDMTAYQSYCLASGLMLSPLLDTQAAASDHVKTLCDLTNSLIVVADGQVHVVPLGDTALTGNGATYTPDLTPIFNLTPDHFLSQSDGPVKITRKTPADAYNRIQVEWLDRSNQYATAVAEARDLVAISKYGVRSQSTISAHWCCDSDTANTIARLALKRALQVLNTYEFSLPWNFAAILPTNILTLTEPGVGLNAKPVRVTQIEEGNKGWKITCEDFPSQVSSTNLYTAASGLGFAHNYNAPPGSVVAPFFIEPPVELTTTGLEVWVAVTGNSANWGGCNVWCSYDGTNYKQVGTVRGGARYGELTATLSSTATSGLAVQLSGNGGQILSGSSTDAANLATLCWMRGNGSTDQPEFLAYQTATLTGTNAYTLSGLVRGAYESDMSAQLVNAQFARIDDAIAKGDPLQVSMIGQTIKFKFVSFNIYGGALEDIATVAEYDYTVRGYMALLPPPNVASFLVSTQADGTRQFSWSWGLTNKPVDLKGYVIRYLAGAGPYTWDQMQPFDTDDGFHTSSPLESNQLLAGPYVFAIKTIDTFGVMSANALFIDATLPDPRLGSAIEFTDEHAAGWPGTLSSCVVDVWGGDTILRASDAATWATIPSTWSTYTRWVWDPATSFQYVTVPIDLGTTVATTPIVNAVANGTITTEVSTSPDGTTWSAWAAIAGPLVTRYIKVRVTVTIPTGSSTGPGVTPICTLSRLTVSYIGKVSTETGNDQDISTYTGVHRTGAGNVRLPTQKVWAHISRVSVALQSVGAGWSWVLIDKDGTNGPNIHIYNGSGALADPPLIDWTIEGIAT